jgi:hypothetical protein
LSIVERVRTVRSIKPSMQTSSRSTNGRLEIDPVQQVVELALLVPPARSASNTVASVLLSTPAGTCTSASSISITTCGATRGGSRRTWIIAAFGASESGLPSRLEFQRSVDGA